jgi:arylsulfatase
MNWMTAAILAPLAALSAAGATKQKPNIVVILADDMGYSDIGCYGGEIRTPNLDALAANGLRFTQFYNDTRCCPSRASLLTGLYPHQAGMGQMCNDAGAPGYRGSLQPHTATIAEVLRSAGYRTFMVGKWHLSNPGPIERGFEEFYGMLGGFGSCWDEKPGPASVRIQGKTTSSPTMWSRGYERLPKDRTRRDYAPGKFYSTDVFADYALDFLASARRESPGKPWFLYLAFNAPHFPLHAYPEDIAKYQNYYLRGWDAIRAERLEKMKGLGIVPPATPLPPLSEWRHPWQNKGGVNPTWDSLPEDRRRDLARRMAVYAAMVDRMDAAIGRVTADLRAAGELDNTLIVFLSDNGACAEWDPIGFDVATGPATTNILHTGDDLEFLGGPDSYISYGSGWANACNTPWRLYKQSTHEGGISTPLIAHWPAGISAKGELRAQHGHLPDIMATVVEVTGAPYPARSPIGVPITPMEGKSLLPAFAGQPLQRGPIFWEHYGSAAVRDGKWKLVRANRVAAWELYDMETDRTELDNLAASQPEKVKDLATQWEAWAERALVKPYPTR